MVTCEEGVARWLIDIISDFLDSNAVDSIVIEAYDYSTDQYDYKP